MPPNLRHDSHGYLVIAYDREEGERIAKYLCARRWRLILWFNDLNDGEEPPNYRLAVSTAWLETNAGEHDYKLLRDFIAEWERLYPGQVRWVDFSDESERILPGPSPLEEKLKGKRAGLVTLDEIEDITK